jgi:hypothetical protein
MSVQIVLVAITKILYPALRTYLPNNKIENMQDEEIKDVVPIMAVSQDAVIQGG